MLSPIDLDYVRAQFPALRREENGEPVVYLDGPAGSQVPQRVADAISGYLLRHNANAGGAFRSSQETNAMFEDAAAAFSNFFGAGRSDEVVFGANMTTLTYALSRSLVQTWQPGDEIIVSQMEHDSNVSPWVHAARVAGVTVRYVDMCDENSILDMGDFESKLGPKTKFVAVGYASNITGTVHPVQDIAKMAHRHGALVWVDAVHYAPHGLIDVEQLGCDFLVASAYKFFGPHVGILWGRHDLLSSLPVQKLRPVTDTTPDRWMTGTPNYEGIIGAAEAVRYLAALGAHAGGKGDERSLLHAAFEVIGEHEKAMARLLLSGISELPAFHVWGVGTHESTATRAPTVSVTHNTLSPKEMAARLAAVGIYTWCGNHYALPYTERVGLEPDGTLRMGLLHYNTRSEVERLLEALAGL